MKGLDPSQLVGQVLESKYRVEQHLGSGAMGSVFRARHVRLPRSFAIKMLNPKLVGDEKSLRRFEREAQLAGRLAHRNVVGVLDFGEADGVAYLVMELAVGVPLSNLLPAAPFERARAVDLIGQLCDGLEHAHAQGLVHRDLKPDNIIVDTSHGPETARIVDFGIAVLRESLGVSPHERLTTGGLVLGTPHFMAPEVAMARAFDHRADLFALGVICYEMLTGRLPFEGDGVAVVHANVNCATPAMSERAPGVCVDPMLEDFTRRLMAKNPDDRPPSAAAARELLTRTSQVARTQATRPPASDRASQAARASDLVALGSAQTLAFSTLEHRFDARQVAPARAADDDGDRIELPAALGNASRG